MSQETVARILAIEQKATKLHDEAQQQAADIIAKAQAAADLLHQQEIKRAHQQAEDILAAGKEKAANERTQIIGQAEAEAQRLNATATKNFERAVNFVLTQIVAHE